MESKKQKINPLSSVPFVVYGMFATPCHGMQSYCFLLQAEEVAALKQLTQQDLVEFAHQVLGPSSSSRRKMLVLVRGQREIKEEQQQIGGTAAEAGSAGAGDAAAGGGGGGGDGEITPARNGDVGQAQCDASDSGAGVVGAKVNGEVVGACLTGGGANGEQVCSSGRSRGDSGAAVAAAAVGAGEVLEVIEDVWAFKRRCELYPSTQGRWKVEGVGVGAAAAAAAGGDGTAASKL